MTRPTLPAAALIALASAASLSCSRPPERPHILLITIDTLRLDRVSVYGGPAGTTPAIDRLASEGVRFESVQAPRGLTWPSLTSLMTGLQPRTHQVRSNGAMLDDRFVTLPEILRNAGYDTGGFLSNMCDAPNRGLDTLFCAWWEKTGPPPRRTRFQWASHEQATWDASVAREAEAFIRARRDRPFFAWVHFIDPHKPFDPVEDHLAPDYDGSFIPDDDSLDMRTLSQRPLSDSERAQLLTVYDSQVSGVDRLIGRLLDALNETGATKDTLVVLSSDHGEELGDHGVYFYHLCSVYQQVLSIPWILRRPGQLPAGRVVEESAAAVDILPTLLELAGLPVPAGVEGRSWAAQVSGRAAPAAGVTPTFAEWSDQVVVVGLGRWRYVWNPKGISPACLPFVRDPEVRFPLAHEELYDLETDPLQQANIVAGHPERAAELRRLACGFVSEKPFRNPAAIALQPEVRERLESLGYLEGESAEDGPDLSTFCEASR